MTKFGAMLRVAATGAVAALVSMTYAPALAQAETLKFAHIYETSEPFHKWALWAADEIKKRTDGRYDIEVYPSATLGGEAAINEGLALGTIDMIYTSPIFAAQSYGPLAISEAPYMFRDLDHWKAYATSELFHTLSDDYRQQTGNKVLALGYYGERHVTSNKPIITPEDMKNLKIRVPNAPLFKMFPEAVGANATPLAFSEVYLALQQGVVDAQENPLPTIKAKRFHEVQKDIDLTGHITNGMLTIISGTRWNKLSDEDKKIFSDVFAEGAQGYTKDTVQSEKDLVGWFRDQGVNVNEVDRKAFRDAVLPHLNGPAATWTKAQFDGLQALGK